MAEPHPLRSGRTMAAAGVLFLVVLGAVVVALAVRSDGDPEKPNSAITPATASAGGCHPTDTSQEIPRAAPPDITWSLFNNIAVPSSPTAGPLDVRDGVARCYARTPVGALIARQQISIRSSFGPAWRPVVQEQMVAGSGRDAFARLRAKFVPSSQPGTYAQTAGFQFLSYSPQSAVIRVASRGSDGRLWATTSTMVWDGSWKLQPTPDGKTASPAQDLTTLEGFVVWGGV